MQNHLRIYSEFRGEENVPCEVCGTLAVDVHHIEPRSKFGSKRKDEQDEIKNLIALCRKCHDQAHGIRKPKLSAEKLKKIHSKIL